MRRRLVKSGCRVEVMERRSLLTGLTIITHGFNSGVGDWIAEMADVIAGEAGGLSAVAQYTMVVNDNSGPVAASAPVHIGGPTWGSSGNTSGEAILLLDWSDVDTGSASTGTVANAAANWLLQNTVAGHSLWEIPVHLIGHSRGASLMTVLARRLAEAGVWVDHFTSLDPHPVDGVNEEFPFPDYDDTAMSLWSNVIFADNYWRTDGNFIDFNGESVAGAHNLLLTESVLLSSGSYSTEHSDVHLWYHGTIGRTSFPSGDGDADIGSAWYSSPHPARTASGYTYSNVIGGARPSDGLMSPFGGTAARTAVAAIGSQWPNITDLQSTQAVFDLGDQIPISYDYQDRDSSATVSFYLDTDRNPFSGTPISLGSQNISSSSAPESNLFDGSGSGMATGTPYYLLAQITDGARWRYDYWNSAISFVDSTPPAAPSVPDLDPGSDSGVLSDDNLTKLVTPLFTGTAESGSTVRIFADRLEVGSGLAVGGIYSISTSALAPGVHNLTATATDASNNTSDPSGALPVTIDTAAPVIVSTQWNYETGQSLVVTFDEEVEAASSAFQVTLLPDDTIDELVLHEPSVITLSFGELLADGNYRLLIEDLNTDLAGNTLIGAAPYDFYVLAADPNRDRRVDVHDLVILASNWMGTGKTFSEGDSNYDGAVNKVDLGTMAQCWHVKLDAPPLPAAPAPTVAQRPSRTPTRTPTRVATSILA